jgi:hypothetical protein
LWINGGTDEWQNLKKCLPKVAERSYIEMTGTDITSNKLSRRIDNCIHRFNFVFSHEQERVELHEQGKVREVNSKIWVFRRLKDFVIPVTQATA